MCELSSLSISLRCRVGQRVGVRGCCKVHGMDVLTISKGGRDEGGGRKGGNEGLMPSY